jgi:O-antigen ligase
LACRVLNLVFYEFGFVSYFVFRISDLMTFMPSRRKTSQVPADAETAKTPFRPLLLAGMTALLVARPLYPSESAAAQGDGLPMVMLWLALAALWLLGGIGRKRTAIRFGPVDAAVLVLVAWQAFAAAYAVRYGSPRPALNMLWEWVGAGTMFFVARQLIREPGEARAVVAVMLSLMAAISVYGMYQSAIEMPARQRDYAANPEGQLRANGLDYPRGSPAREVFERRLANREPTGTFALTNSLAAALAPWLVVGLWLVAAAWPGRWRTAAWLMCLVPIAVCLVLTKSRSGYVAVAVGVVWLAVSRLRIRPRWFVAAVLLVGMAASAVVFSGIAKAPLARAVTSFGFRLQYWQATLRMIADRPLLGCGPGNFQDVYTQYKLPEASEEVTDPHNFMLEVWATAGTPALVALAAGLGLFATRLCRERPPWRSLPPTERPEPRAGAPHSADGTERHGKERHGVRSLQPASPHAWIAIFIGALAGFLISKPLGMISNAPPSTLAIVFGLPVAAICLGALIPWVRHGAFPPAVTGAGLAVLLIDLLTTGGIGIPAVAQSLWLFLVLGLNVLDLSDLARSAAQPRSAPRGVVILLLAICIGLSYACNRTSYTRVLPCQSDWRSAVSESLAGKRQSALDLMQRAVEADPLSADAAGFLSELYLETWLANLDPADYEDFKRYDTLARRLAPEAAPIWRASADRYRRAFEKANVLGQHLQPQAIEKAVEVARQTVKLYPTSAADCAALAMIYKLAGDEVSYRHEAEIALELDRRMPHQDKKLPDEVRRRLEGAER